MSLPGIPYARWVETGPDAWMAVECPVCGERIKWDGVDRTLPGETHCADENSSKNTSECYRMHYAEKHGTHECG